MKYMKLLHIFLLLPCFFFVSCGGDSNGSINITLNVDALSTTEQANIGHFVFIVTGTGSASSTSVLYPSACLGSNAGNACIKSSICGFAATESSFDPSIAFSDFAKDSTVNITACALDSSSGHVGAGSSNVVNSDGQNANLTINTTNPCTGLPAVCS